MNNVIKAIMTQSPSLTATDLSDVARNGAGGGVSGFTWYTETEAFYDANESLINEMLEQSKDECYGDEVSMIEMLQGFGRGSNLEVVNAEFAYDEEEEETDFEDYSSDQDVVWETLDHDSFEMKAIAKDTQYKNLMAWFLLEEGAHHIEQLVDEQDWDQIETYGIDCTEAKQEVA